MVTLISGLIAGLVATIVMTVFMGSLGDDSPPPTALFYAKFVGGGEPAEYMMQGMVLHLVYGTLAGGIFAAAILFLGFVSVGTLGSALLWALVYAFILFLGGAMFWMNAVLGVDPDGKMIGMFLFFHLVYGLVLGGWIGYGVLA
ncbi:MAG: hypothetical protein ABEJ71_01645 [Halodesulfurarchaeum sp.]